MAELLQLYSEELSDTNAARPVNPVQSATDQPFNRLSFLRSAVCCAGTITRGMGERTITFSHYLASPAPPRIKP